MIKVRLNNIKSAYKELELKKFNRYAITTSGSTTTIDTSQSTECFVKTIGESSITVKINEADARLLSVDDTVVISRYIGDILIARENLTVLYVSDSMVTLSAPQTKRTYFISNVSKEYYKDKNGENKEKETKISLKEDHNIYVNDLDFIKNDNTSAYTISIKSDITNINVSDVLVEDITLDDANKRKLFLTSEYTSITTANTTVIIDGYNPYYIVDVNGNARIWSEIHNDGISRVTLSKYNAYLTTNVSLSNSASYNSLYQQENIDLYFDNQVKNVIPDIIDTERIKYVPYIGNKLAQKLEFNLHFRRRNTDDHRYKMSDNWDIETENNFNGWIRKKSDSTDLTHDDVSYWNSFADYSDIKSGDTNLYNSDLLGYLGFTDSDVYNRKKKLKKSFIRLSFYATNNPIENSLLFYSTIFYDTNKLYTNYINLLNNDDYSKWERTYLNDVSGSTNYNYWGLVFFEGENTISNDKLLTSRFSVTNEFDKTSSAEGYNLYLYKADANIDIDNDIDNDKGRIIYMKVEFNHAGYGRTIPMVLWPKNGKENKGAELTQENVYEQMYIPVHLKYDKETKTFAYYFNDDALGIKNNETDKIIQFALFEPKIG